MINNFDAAFRLLNLGKPEVEAKCKRFRDKLDLFFIDHEFVPLLVHECYLGAMQGAHDLSDIESMANAAEMMSVGDNVNIKIRTEQNWALLPDFGILSSVGPCIAVKGQSSYPYFPQWLGKNSTQRKNKRLLRELK